MFTFKQHQCQSELTEYVKEAIAHAKCHAEKYIIYSSTPYKFQYNYLINPDSYSDYTVTLSKNSKIAIAIERIPDESIGQYLELVHFIHSGTAPLSKQLRDYIVDYFDCRYSAPIMLNIENIEIVLMQR